METPNALGKKPPAVGSLALYKRLDETFNPQIYDYEVTETKERVAQAKKKDPTGPFAEYCFTVVRRFDDPTEHQPTWIRVQFNSKWLKKTCSRVIANQGGVAWSSSQRVLVDVDVLFRFFSPLKRCWEDLKEKSITDANRLEQLGCLLSFIAEERRLQLEEYHLLIARKDITFDFIGNLFIPDTIVFFICGSTGEPRAARTVEAIYQPSGAVPCWHISAVYIDSLGNSAEEGESNRFEHDEKDIHAPVFPMEYHPEKQEVCAKLLERGKRWEALDGIHHVQYGGRAGRLVVNSRVILDHVLYKEYQGTSIEIISPSRYKYSEWEGDENDGEGDAPSSNKLSHLSSLETEHLLLTTPVLYGFSLNDNAGVLSLNVEHITSINWNDEAFANLVLPQFTKDLLRGLVESQGSNIRFDDFIEGKGRGIVICLAGPPGVGKTMSAESVSEHLRRPLYMVGGGELPIHAAGLDTELTRIFKVSARWGAMVLIDEADVFLEKRRVEDLNRNALVAVFLRQLEYFPGLLFLTTNRLSSFDEAFQSRIHVSLRFKDLDLDARRKIWHAFIAKLGELCDRSLTASQVAELASKPMNGRQIKNAVRTASALATSRKETVAFSHLMGVVEIMEQFERDYKATTEG